MLGALGGGGDRGRESEREVERDTGNEIGGRDKIHGGRRQEERERGWRPGEVVRESERKTREGRQRLREIGVGEDRGEPVGGRQWVGGRAVRRGRGRGNVHSSLVWRSEGGQLLFTGSKQVHHHDSPGLTHHQTLLPRKHTFLTCSPGPGQPQL